MGKPPTVLQKARAGRVLRVNLELHASYYLVFIVYIVRALNQIVLGGGDGDKESNISDLSEAGVGWGWVGVES